MTFAMYGAARRIFLLTRCVSAAKRRLHEYRGRTRLNPGYTLTPRISGRMGMYTEKYGPRLFMTLGPIVFRTWNTVSHSSHALGQLSTECIAGKSCFSA